MRILLHDFAGYPYPIQVSRELARRGHEVLHVYCDSIATTPTGIIPNRESDPASLTLAPVSLAEPLQKYSFVKRWRQENEAGRLVAGQIDTFKPDVVVSANSPLDAHRHIMRASARNNSAFVFWVQDLLGVASAKLLAKKIPVIGRAIGTYYKNLELRQIKSSDAAILLTEDFVPLLTESGVPESNLVVIENWAPIEELPVCERHNSWSAENSLDDRLTFLYAGTLGLKHDPSMLAALADAIKTNPSAAVIVLAQGPGADWLREEARRSELTNLTVRDYEPFDRMPEVLASADVLVALLEEDAGVFSVPSKILAYLCARRPLLLSIPKENLAAKIVTSAAAGVVVAPGNKGGFSDGARLLMNDPEMRAAMGKAGREYAERAFRIKDIADRFEAVLLDLHSE